MPWRRRLRTRRAKLEESIKDAEAKATESFDAGIAAGAEQELGKIKARMDKYKDAAFVIETLELDDGEVKDKHIARLEEKLADAAVAQAAEVAELGKAEVTVEAKSTEELIEARASELKAEGKSAEEAWKTAHSELNK
jgi:hypothetical protein